MPPNVRIKQHRRGGASMQVKPALTGLRRPDFPLRSLDLLLLRRELCLQRERERSSLSEEDITEVFKMNERVQFEIT